MRVEVRSVSPDSNPYLVMYSIFKAGIDGETAKIKIFARPSAICRTTFTPPSTFSKAEWTTNSSAPTSKAATPI